MSDLRDRVAKAADVLERHFTHQDYETFFRRDFENAAQELLSEPLAVAVDAEISSDQLWAAAMILANHYQTGEGERTEVTTRRMFEAAGFVVPEGWPDEQSVEVGAGKRNDDNLAVAVDAVPSEELRALAGSMLEAMAVLPGDPLAAYWKLNRDELTRVIDRLDLDPGDFARAADVGGTDCVWLCDCGVWGTGKDRCGACGSESLRSAAVAGDENTPDWRETAARIRYERACDEDSGRVAWDDTVEAVRHLYRSEVREFLDGSAVDGATHHKPKDENTQLREPTERMLHAAMDHMRGANRDIVRREAKTILRAALAALAGGGEVFRNRPTLAALGAGEYETEGGQYKLIRSSKGWTIYEADEEVAAGFSTLTAAGNWIADRSVADDPKGD